MDGKKLLRKFSKERLKLDRVDPDTSLRRQVSGDGRTADIEYTPDWRGALHDKLVDFGCIERFACITDNLGVEIRIWDDSVPEPTPERFPLHIRCHEPTKASFCGPSTPTTPSELFDSGGVQQKPLGSNGVYPGHVCIVLHFADLWPGILDLKLLDEQAANACIVVTDKTGVELAADYYTKNLPAPEHFPLKIHFRSKCPGPQNMAPRELTNSRSFKSRSDSFTPHPTVDHSFELRYGDILPTLIQSKFAKEVGVQLDRAQRNQVLITDCVGIVVNVAEGVPECDRYPLKLHIEGSALTTADVSQLKFKRGITRGLTNWWK